MIVGLDMSERRRRVQVRWAARGSFFLLGVTYHLTPRVIYPPGAMTFIPVLGIYIGPLCVSILGNESPLPPR